jgi:hypothetical protein
VWAVQPVNITIPELSLVVSYSSVLAGCGKSSFARTHFKPTEVLSLDFYRGRVSDDENAQAATVNCQVICLDFFDRLHELSTKYPQGFHRVFAVAGDSQGRAAPGERRQISALTSLGHDTERHPVG